jgi:2-polyprenyl-3-methyl-5-hydroxy-6-metoxy-1,4-benzoquinol methylase
VTPASDFDARAATWDADPAKVERALRVADAIAREVPDLASRSVLDYGAGTGLLGFALLQRAAHVTFADASEGMLEEVRAKIARIGATSSRALLLDLLRDAPPPGRFGLVCSLMTLHHVEDVPALLAAFHGILEPGGVIGLSDLDTEDGSFHGEGFTGHRGFDRKSIAAMLERAGFGPASFSTPFEVRKGAAGAERVYPAFLAVARRGP